MTTIPQPSAGRLPNSQELLQWETRFELDVRGAEDGVWDWDLLNDQVYFSSRWKSMLGYAPDELSDEFGEWRKRIHPEDLDKIREAIDLCVSSQAPEYAVEYRVLHKNGAYIHIFSRAHLVKDDKGRPTRLLGTHVDITGRDLSDTLLKERNLELEDSNKKLKQAQTMLMRQEKMASIGQLAAGVAHEINNPMGYIQSNIATLENYFVSLTTVLAAYEVAETHVNDPAVLAEIAKVKEEQELDYLIGDAKELISETRGGVERIIKIVNDLKGFSYLGKEEWEQADIIPCIENTLSIVHNELKYKAEIVQELEPVPEITCVPSQLNQVILNLLINAGHAIQDGGIITIRAGREGESNVYVEVEDNGHGIPKEKLANIFEPFFTTKPVGKGTGLGLSIAYGIIEKHHGQISVESEEGRGTKFRVVLPVAGSDPPSCVTARASA